MKNSLAILATYVVLTASANSQEPAAWVQTSGAAELSRASEAMIDPARRNIPIRLPATVRKGDVISIQYEDSGNTVADSFMVTGITINNGTCTLESKRDTTVGTALVDTIHTRPCKKIE
jgi:hypothetical protein